MLSCYSCKKTKSTDGKIIGNTYNPIIGGSWSAKAWYSFEVDGKEYIDTLVYTGIEGPHAINEIVKIEYNISDPSDNKLKN